MSHHGERVSTKTQRGNHVFIVLYVLFCYFLLLTVSVKAGSCSCPSCSQRDAVQRCACCVYRQYGKRSQPPFNVDQPNTYSDVFSSFENEPSMKAEASKSWLDSDDVKNFDDSISDSDADSAYEPDTRSRSNPTPYHYSGDLVFHRRNDNINRNVLEKYWERAKLLLFLFESMEATGRGDEDFQRAHVIELTSADRNRSPGNDFADPIEIEQEVPLQWNLKKLVSDSRRK